MPEPDTAYPADRPQGRTGDQLADGARPPAAAGSGAGAVGRDAGGIRAEGDRQNTLSSAGRAGTGGIVSLHGSVGKDTV